MTGFKSLPLRHALMIGVAALGTAGTVGYSSAAFAQDATDGAADDGAIVVTGSRIARSTFSSANPVTVIGAAQVEALGQTNAAETLKIIPQNMQFQSATNVGLNAPQQQGNVGVETANLRGLNPSNGGVRTLVLVDTHRFVPSTPGGGVDLNQVPSMLIGSVEVVTGGASAQYGSDAVAGVVNLILDKELRGFKGQIDYGQTFHGDGANSHISLAYGNEFAGGRGRFIVGGEYSDDDGIGDCSDSRSWCFDSWYVAENQQQALNGLPHWIIGPQTRTSQYSLGGTIRSLITREGGPILGNAPDSGSLAPPNTALQNLARTSPVSAAGFRFADDGRSLVQYDVGLFEHNVFGVSQGGAFEEQTLWTSESAIRVPAERMSFLGRGEFDFTDSITGYFEANYASRKNVYLGNSQGPQSTFLLNSNNAYLNCYNYQDLSPAARLVPGNCQPVLAPNGVPLTDTLSRRWNVLSAGASQGVRLRDASGAFIAPTIGAFTWAKHMEEAARPVNLSEAETTRFVAGLEGEIFGRWNWDAYYQYGDTSQIEDLTLTRTDNFFRAAIDAVFDASGNIVCNVNSGGDINGDGLPDHPQASDPAYAGCVPINLIGRSELDGRLTQEARDYAYRTQDNDFEYQQQIFGGNIRGELFGGFGAGPIGAAAGFELRREEGAVTHGDEFIDNPATPEDESVTGGYYRFFSRPQIGFPYSGELEVNEGYVEVNVPLARDLPMLEYLEVGAAYRNTWQTNTDTTPGFEDSKDLEFSAWKINLDWAVTDWVRFRGTRSQDVRAAGFRDLYFKGTPTAYGTTEGRLNNPWATEAGQPGPDGAGPQGDALDFAVAVQAGNFELEPETGDTTTLGVVFTPGGFLEGLRVSIDWYEIELSDALTNITFQNVLDECYNNGNFCSFIQEDTGGNNTGPFVAAAPGQFIGDIGTIRAIPINLGLFRQTGVDFEVDYALPLDRVVDRWTGVLSYRGIYTLVEEFLVDPNSETVGDEVDYAGQSAPGFAVAGIFGNFNPGPEWRSNHWITYSNGGFSGTFGARYVGEGIVNVNFFGPDDPRFATEAATSILSINDNTVDSSWIYSLAFSYEFNPFENPDASSEMFIAMDNIFDTDPAVAPSANGFSTNPVYFDTQGARFRAGLRLRY